MARVVVDGKQFALEGRRFRFRGVTYGTFRPRPDGARFPEREGAKRDMASMAQAGFSVVRTYTAPPDDLVELAADWDLRLLAGAFYPDWRYLVGLSRRGLRRVAKDARDEVRATARRLAGADRILGLSLGNEVPADVLRWVGTGTVAGVIDELVDVAREEDPDRLLTYANYPTAEYLPLDRLDFLTFNVFLERRRDFRRYLTRLQNLAGDRPLVLGEMGLDAGGDTGADGDGGGERAQAEAVDWQMETALERGVAGTCLFSWTDEWWVGDAEVKGWHFGLTRADRSPRPALAVAEEWNGRDVTSVRRDWPTMSVVVCAYNAEATIDECLRHACALDYPGLEVIVVDDGSTDGTADAARRHPAARLVEIEHGGLSVARNAGMWAASGDIVAYLDSDAYPTPEWPWLLALGFDEPDVGAAGGPNVPPPDDPWGAQQVARAPGGPVQVLIGDDRAEHVPGCNMAFRRPVLHQVGGFDPVFTAAGDDVDACWKVLDAGWKIGFHPAALVWHHRRAGLRPYLRQQRGYGRAEALVEARHPDRFTALGTARWQGRIYNTLLPPGGRQRIYRGPFGTAAYQSVYHAGGHGLDLAHQIGVPVAVGLLASAPFGVVSPWLALPAAAALAALLVLAGVDMALARPPRRIGGRPVRGWGVRFRAGVAVLHLLQPLVRNWGRAVHRWPALRDVAPTADLPRSVEKPCRGVLLYPQDRPREHLAGSAFAHLREAGLRVLPAGEWDDCDGHLAGGAFVTGKLITSAHPEGTVQLRVRRRPRWTGIGLVLVVLALVAMASVVAAAGGAVLALLELARELWCTGPLVTRVLRRASP